MQTTSTHLPGLRAGAGIAVAAATVLAISCLALPVWAAESGARSVGTTMDDAAITTSIKTRLIADKDTKARQINVETSRGVVQLNGFVDSATAKSEAERIASGVDGVTSVENKLQVRAADHAASTAVDNGELSARVDSALAADPRTSALSVDVESRNGEVQLSGYVKSSQERLAAVEVAGKVAGVHKVKDAMDIR